VVTTELLSIISEADLQQRFVPKSLVSIVYKQGWKRMAKHLYCHWRRSLYGMNYPASFLSSTRLSLFNRGISIAFGQTCGGGETKAVYKDGNGCIKNRILLPKRTSDRRQKWIASDAWLFPVAVVVAY